MPSYNSTARVPFKSGGRVGLKHGKYVRVPTPHADISKYITKNGKSEGPKGEDTQYRQEDSTMKAPKKKKSWITKKKNFGDVRDKGLGGKEPKTEWIKKKKKSKWISRKSEGGRIGLKKGGGEDKWIQKATKNMRKDKPCTGKKFGGASCPPGSKRYNLAKTFKKMGKARSAA